MHYPQPAIELMIDKKMLNRISLITFWKKHNETIILLSLLFIFLSFSILTALNLRTGIIPDEIAHFRFSKHYASTLGIPPDVFETYALGWIIEQNPFLYYWINGRIINLIRWIRPNTSDWHVLVILRLVNVSYSLGTAIFCFLLSREVIKKRWWRLLPVFFLTNTLMFVFLSGGVNYDNLANLFSIAGLYFLFRVFNQKDFVSNSLLWIILIALGCLVKYPILPLGFIMTVVWLVYTIKTRPKIIISDIFQLKPILFAISVVILLAGNFVIYGLNLIRYQSLIPPCREILLESQCEISPYERRYQEIAMEPRLTIRQSMEMGYPNPIFYAGNTWVRIMILRTFGIAGHLSYSPEHLVNFYRIMVYGMILITLIFIKKYNFITYSLIGISAFYSSVLIYQNYTSELVYGFLHIAFQGRYIFPVIGAIYTVIPSVLLSTKNRYLQLGIVNFSILLFISGSPIVVLLRHGYFFMGWFIK